MNDGSPQFEAREASDAEMWKFMADGEIGDLLFSGDPDPGTAISWKLGYMAPCELTRLRIEIGLEPPEKLAEVSNGEQTYDPETGLVIYSDEYMRRRQRLIDGVRRQRASGSDETRRPE